MKLNDIIVLDNNEQYTLLKETEKDGNKYYFAAGVDQEGHVNQSILVILKLIKEEDGDYVEVVEDEDLLNELSEKFKDTFK
ncbi:MAG: DUF1292 domain-containing protein [Bacilli bacterium]|nr:DUF1292 domain-containing protein [Bacilli bacterium]